MNQDMMDLMCLRALKVNAESDRVALTAASIIVHAHAIARDAPGARHDALRIVALARTLYAVMPSREGLGRMVEEGFGEVAAARGDGAGERRARERLVDRLWRYFHQGARPGGPARPDRG